MPEKEPTRNTPLLIIIGVLMLLFVVPFVLALVTLIVYGEFTLPEQVLIGGLMNELDANFVLAMLITILPLLLVWTVESSRGRVQDERRSKGLTLALLIVLMVGVTAVPVLFYLKPLAGVPGGQSLAILSVVALPLLLVMFVVAVLLPGLLREKNDGSANNAGSEPTNG